MCAPTFDADEGRIRQLDRWVLVVALNLARSRWRRVRREVLQRDVAPAGEPEGDAVSIDLRRALRDLTVRQREVVVLHHVLDYSVADVAGLVDLTPGGVTRGIANTGRTIRLPVHASDTLARLQKARSRLELKYRRPADAVRAGARSRDA